MCLWCEPSTNSGHTHFTNYRKSFCALFCICFSACITFSCKNCLRTSEGSLLMSILFKSIKIFVKFFSHHKDVEYVFNSYNCLNQAINQKVVGPLFLFLG